MEQPTLQNINQNIAKNVSPNNPPSSLPNVPQGNPAKFAFFYMLSLVALIFMALSTGMIIFEIINRKIVDLTAIFDSGTLKFAIASIIISAPIYYVMMWQINKSLFSGTLKKDSGVRRWLTYFILFISAIVVIGWLIATINSFLNGELTTKFVLKALTAIIISAAIFYYYFYDIKREMVEGMKDKVIMIFFYTSLAVVLITLVASFFFVESPSQARARRQDDAIISNFNIIDNAVNAYYYDNKKLPAKIADMLQNKNYYLTADNLNDPTTKKPFDYKIVNKDIYELCATFQSLAKDQQDANIYFDPRWPHNAGYQCISQNIRSESKQTPVAVPPIIQKQ